MVYVYNSKRIMPYFIWINYKLKMTLTVIKIDNIILQ